jgi:hypothetical protein
LSFREACGVVGREPGPRSTPRPATAAWKPKDKEAPPEVWQAKARAFLDDAIKALWTPAGAAVRRWLHDNKGLTETSIRKAMLGYASRDLYAPREAWALPDDKKRVWIPAGLVIPYVVNDVVHRLRIRRTESTGPRYVIVSGSSSAPMLLGADKAAAVVVESELDALLLAQAAGDLAAVVALGNAQAKPDIEAHKLLQNTPLILMGLDADEAGAKAAWDFWPQTYGPKARRWLSILGKDASEANQKGLSIRDWIIAGMFGDEDLFERFAIQTIDGGLSDGEAMKLLLGGSK